ncbi:hypothetical protein NQ318_013522 [Aromia moschata]|uniref:Integrase zinc-binding domain-containing protein n=1 Tax=Aromia moschata TaxID=1265417 RepID=A0AAV8YEH7_9CUCU|nr:hypothetical protein NQ318_013522 [Aromia moschata]
MKEEIELKYQNRQKKIEQEIQEKKSDSKRMKSDDWRMNDDGRRTVRRQKGERKSDDRRTNNDDERTVRRQNDDDRRTVRRQKGERKSDGRRTNGGDRRTVRRQKGERNSDGKRTNGGDRRTNDDDKRTETRRRGAKKVNRIEKEFQENREEIERRLERRLEDTKRQVQKEILEKIEGLEHQLHRTSIADSGDCSTSPATPLQHSSLMHTERSVHKMLKPPTYDGQSSWSMYRRQFEAAAKANGWTPQEMATSLVISLRGQALEILQSIPEEQQNDYDRIVGALEIRYGHKYLRQVYQSQIKSRQQRSNESLQEYEADIERLIHLAYPQAPKEFLEQIGIQTFIDGLVDTEMQQALRLGRHTTISDALVAALEFKAAKEASRSYKSRSRQEELERRKQDTDEYAGQEWSLPFPKARISLQVTTERFGKRQLVDARGRVSTTYTQCPKISISDKSSDAEREPGRAGAGDVRSAPFCGQHDERVGDIKKQEQVHLRGRHGQTEGVLPVLDSSKDTCNELLMTTTVQVEDEWSSEEVMKSQKKDNDLRLIRNWVKNGVRPTWQEVSRYGTTIKGYWAQWSSLCLRDGLLHRKWESPDGVSAVYQLVLPKARIHQVLEELHSSPSGGHFGVTRTLARVRDRFYWKMKLPTDLILGRPLEENQERSLPEFVKDLRERLDRIHRFASEKLKMHSDKMKQRLDTTSTETAFEPGDAVWLYAPKRMKGRSPKLQKNWEGPYTIIKKINDLVYRIQLSPRSKPKVVHLERLARYTGHDPPDWFVVEDPPPRTEDSVIRDE